MKCKKEWEERKAAREKDRKKRWKEIEMVGWGCKIRRRRRRRMAAGKPTGKKIYEQLNKLKLFSVLHRKMISGFRFVLYLPQLQLYVMHVILYIWYILRMCCFFHPNYIIKCISTVFICFFVLLYLWPNVQPDNEKEMAKTKIKNTSERNSGEYNWTIRLPSRFLQPIFSNWYTILLDVPSTNTCSNCTYATM